MALTIMLQPDIEARFREEAASKGIAPEQLAAQRVLEADLLWRIRTVAPDDETRELHRLLRRRNASALNNAESLRLQNLLDEREQRAASRLTDLAQLAHLRNVSVRSLMKQLAIRPIPSP